jgi:hypothetical protein
MEREPSGDQAEVTPEDEGIPEHGGPAPGKRETGDSQEGLLTPGDEPRAADRFGTTAEEQREGETLDEKLAEERPDRRPQRSTSMGRLVEPGSGVTDREKEEVAEEAEEDRSGLSPEETAMREEEEPKGLTDGPDQYVQDDRP